MRARGTPDAQRIRSLACKSEKHTSVVTTVAPKSSGVPHAVVGTACCVIIPGVRCWVHHRYADLRMSVAAPGEVTLSSSRPWRKPMRRDHTPWAVRAGAFRRSGLPVRRKNAPHLKWSAPALSRRHIADCALGVGRQRGRTKTARPLARRAPDHPAAFEHRARPPHPAPRIVTIASRPSMMRRDKKECQVSKIGSLQATNVGYSAIKGAQSLMFLSSTAP